MHIILYTHTVFHLTELKWTIDRMSSEWSFYFSKTLPDVCESADMLKGRNHYDLKPDNTLKDRDYTNL